MDNRPARWRPPINVADKAERDEILGRMRKKVAEIEQYFDDVDHYNRTLAERGEGPVDADPDGELRRQSAYLRERIRAALDS